MFIFISGFLLGLSFGLCLAVYAVNKNWREGIKAGLIFDRGRAYKVTELDAEDDYHGHL
jgi:hypothetical protein